MILTALIFLLILTVLVLIHEWGHFIVARKLNIKVEEFGFGLPPRLWGIKIGETLYSINWLPIGGFVKLFGEDEAGAGKVGTKVTKSTKKSELHRAFFMKSPWQRASVVVAGVVMNAVLAAIIFYIYLGISGFKTEIPLLANYKFFGAHQQNITGVIIRDVAKDSPAEKIGIKPPVKIISVGGKEITDVKDFIKIINDNKGKELTVVWQDIKTYQIYTSQVTPRKNPPKKEGALGVAFSPLPLASLTYPTAVEKAFSGITYPANLVLYNFDVLGQLIKISYEQKTPEPVSEGVSGPVGIYFLVGSILEIKNIKEVVLQLLNLAGILSISLAFFNVLPIPALDGGRLFYILIEAITGKKVNEKFESTSHAIGMAILLALIALIAFKDIFQLLL